MNDLLASIWMPDGTDLRLFSPELALVATLAALLVVPLITGRSNHVAAAIALIGSFVTLLLSGWLLRHEVAGSAYGGMSPGGLPPMLVADKFALFFKLFLMTFLVLVTWLWLIGLWSAPHG